MNSDNKFMTKDSDKPMDSGSKFKNASGVLLTKGLFIEFHTEDKEQQAIYTLSNTDKVVDGVVYPSLYRLYMETNDLTEAEFISKYLYNNEHWERLQRTRFLSAEIPKWRKELKVRLYGRMVKLLLSDAEDPHSKTKTASAKYLIDKIVKPTNAYTKAGRPSKSTESDLPLSEADKDIESDFNRIVKLIDYTDQKKVTK